ncbi:MAG: OmpH family outer membrane protein [Gammaproteobacteria bacterium]|jgi:outer membrane protein|nr:OmpH family outer membrane protein [Gammaproteobacteria bacterium]
MFKQKMILLAMLAAGPVVPTVAAAQATDGLKIGVVNVGRLLQESPQIVAARERIQDEFAPRQREIVAMQTALEAKAAEVQKNMEVMGAEERENAQRDLRNDERSLVRAQNEFREDLDLRNNESLGAIQNEVLGEIRAFGENSDFDLIMVDGIVYASGRVDITQQVLDRLKANYKPGGS